MDLPNDRITTCSGNGQLAEEATSESTSRRIKAGWLDHWTVVATDWKDAIANYVANHPEFIDYAAVIQLGSGTSFNKLMEKIVDRQRVQHRGLDLIILTNNLKVLEIGRDAQCEDAGVFSTMQIVLTGGSLQFSLHSLVGKYAEEGVRSQMIRPNVVFFGAAGLSFDSRDVNITYQFHEELSTQVSYGTRPTDHRVILCDHTKLGKKSAWNSGITVKSMLETTDRCTIISTFPESPTNATDRERKETEHQLQVVEAQVKAFEQLLESLAADPYFQNKEFVLRLVDREARVKREFSLSERRAKGHRQTAVKTR
jgi:DeoR/GlpR family transcriptional regulator of sugar metabolism